MLGTSLKRKISRLHPSHAQPSSSDDDESVGALGAYDRLLELSACPVSSMSVPPATEAPQAAQGNTPLPQAQGEPLPMNNDVWTCKHPTMPLIFNYLCIRYMRYGLVAMFVPRGKLTPSHTVFVQVLVRKIDWLMAIALLKQPKLPPGLSQMTVQR